MQEQQLADLMMRALDELDTSEFDCVSTRRLGDTDWLTRDEGFEVKLYNEKGQCATFIITVQHVGRNDTWTAEDDTEDDE